MDYEFRESSSHYPTHTDESVTYYLPVHTQPFWQQPTQYPAYFEVPMTYQPTMRDDAWNYWQADARQFFPVPLIPPIIPGPFIGPIIPPVPIYPPFPPIPPVPPFVW